MHPDDELPPRASFRSERPSLLHGAALLLGTVFLIYGAIFLWLRATEPIAVSGTSASTDEVRPPAAASPFVIVFPDTLTLVTQTPIPSPELTPTYTMLPTPRPVAVCLTSTPKGELCTMPALPLPSPTPIQRCPVMPGELCLSSGGPVTWLTATPTWGPNTTSGSVNN